MAETKDIELAPIDSPDKDEAITMHPVVKWFHLDELEDINFVTSHFVPTSVLFVVRLILSVYATIVLVTSFAADLEDGWWLAYFTHLTFTGLTTYLIASTIHTGLYLARGDIRSLTEQPRIFRWLYWIAYEHAVAYHLIVPAVYWFALAPSGYTKFGFWLSGSMHGLDFVFIVIEIILSKNRVVLRHIIFYMVTSIVYLFYTWILYAIPIPTEHGYPDENRWVYPFLDWYASSAVVWYIGLLIAFIVVYFACFGVHRFREYAAEKRK